MNNLIFEKVWEEDTFIEIKITAKSKYSTSYQMCYVDEDEINKMNEKIAFYIADYSQDIYIEFGEKKGNYTPAFSMEIKKADIYGHVKIEVDLEIDDIDDRSHRCKYFVESELGALENFRQKALNFYNSEIGTKISMFLE
ncbi:hypothetical protein SHT65_03490 [Enterococcus faecalis]|uniref:hypothetical protein n=1 Tax=Enterococcus faecalis TaxID=1351 RepID=UPI00033047CB|nr:hypothetical protein [Enterococcus faecalis]EIY7149604.1 hypothetical protein [Enterococcus faecalis]EMC2390611.1 hypothetical protein [Enterococcus faecalis]EOJ72299.1 hypothetical protein WMU_00707 [Enterococcus faecalis EnGen0351]MDT2165447.1 hypothetical protein [Enterococcus faecalis]WPH38391.1 hypothetical protein SHT65_03490 [Enterococcus faecalis]